MGTEESPGDFLAKVLRIVVPVLIITAIALFVLFFYLLTVMPPISVLPDPDPIPHSRLRAVEGRLHDMPEPVDYQVLGNASTSQYMAVVSKTGSLWVFVSNDTFENNVTRVILEEWNTTDPTPEALSLGRDRMGMIAVGIGRGTERRGWVLERWPDAWVPIEGRVEISVPSTPRVDPDSLPSRGNVVGWPEGWDSLVLGDRNVAVGTYRYTAGCMDETCCPSLVFVTDDGDWSTVVVLGRQRVDRVRVAGSGLDDMFIVSVDMDEDGALWYCTIVDKEGILALGQAPPMTGVD